MTTRAPYEGASLVPLPAELAGKRAAAWQAGDAGARAQVRQRVGDGGGGSSDMIL